MKIHHNEPRLEIGDVCVGTVLRFTGGVGDHEPCIKIVQCSTTNCAVISLVSGGRYSVTKDSRIQKLDVELHVLGESK